MTDIIIWPTVWYVGSNNLAEWSIKYFGHGDEQLGEPSASLLVEQWANQTFSIAILNFATGTMFASLVLQRTHVCPRLHITTDQSALMQSW